MDALLQESRLESTIFFILLLSSSLLLPIKYVTFLPTISNPYFTIFVCLAHPLRPASKNVHQKSGSGSPTFCQIFPPIVCDISSTLLQRRAIISFRERRSSQSEHTLHSCLTLTSLIRGTPLITTSRLDSSRYISSHGLAPAAIPMRYSSH